MEKRQDNGSKKKTTEATATNIEMLNLFFCVFYPCSLLSQNFTIRNQSSFFSPFASSRKQSQQNQFHHHHGKFFNGNDDKHIDVKK